MQVRFYCIIFMKMRSVSGIPVMLPLNRYPGLILAIITVFQFVVVEKRIHYQ